MGPSQSSVGSAKRLVSWRPPDGLTSFATEVLVLTTRIPAPEMPVVLGCKNHSLSAGSGTGIGCRQSQPITSWPFGCESWWPWRFVVYSMRDVVVLGGKTSQPIIGSLSRC
jgi:hypothetical protein